MSRFHAEFQRLGGPGAVTWWAFFVSLGDRLLTVSVQPLNMAAPAWARVVATVIAGIAMFIPLVILRFTLLKDPLRPRPWVALAGFAVAVVIRGLVADQMLHHLGGMPLMPALRVFSGFVSTMIPLIVTAYVVNTLRERRRDLAALLDVRERLERARTESEAAVQLSNESLVQRVRTVMEAELSALSGEQPSGVVSQLQRTATEVVRPLSHELATSFAKREGPEVVEPPAKVGWREVVRDASLDRPLNPALATLVLAGIWIAAALTLATIRWPLMASLAAVPLSLAGANAILRRVLPRLAPLGRIAAVGVACLASGVAVGLAMRVLLGSWSNATFTAIAGASTSSW